MAKQIIVTISSKGEVEVKVQGHAGPGCKDLTRQLEAELGQTQSDQWTAEYHLSEANLNRLTNGR